MINGILWWRSMLSRYWEHSYHSLLAAGHYWADDNKYLIHTFYTHKRSLKYFVLPWFWIYVNYSHSDRYGLGHMHARAGAVFPANWAESRGLGAGHELTPRVTQLTSSSGEHQSGVSNCHSSSTKTICAWLAPNTLKGCVCLSCNEFRYLNSTLSPASKVPSDTDRNS